MINNYIYLAILEFHIKWLSRKRNRLFPKTLHHWQAGPLAHRTHACIEMHDATERRKWKASDDGRVRAGPQAQES